MASLWSSPRAEHFIKRLVVAANSYLIPTFTDGKGIRPNLDAENKNIMRRKKTITKSNLLTDQSFVVLDKSLGSPRPSRVPHWEGILSQLLKIQDYKSISCHQKHLDKPARLIIRLLFEKHKLNLSTKSETAKLSRSTCMKRRPFGSMASPSVCDGLFPTCQDVHIQPVKRFTP